MQIKCSGTCPAPLERPERALCRDWGEICAATGNSWSRSCISGRYCHISCCARCVTIKDYPSQRSWLILCVNFKSVLQFAIDVAIVFVCVSTWKLKKSNPTRVWRARNPVSIAAKMTSSSIEPRRLCRSATVTQYRYRASLYLVTTHFCESTRYSQLRMSGTKTIEKRISCYFSWWVTSWSSLWVTSVISDGEKRGEDVVCVWLAPWINKVTP